MMPASDVRLLSGDKVEVDLSLAQNIAEIQDLIASAINEDSQSVMLLQAGHRIDDAAPIETLLGGPGLVVAVDLAQHEIHVRMNELVAKAKQAFEQARFLYNEAVRGDRHAWTDESFIDQQ